MKKVLSLLLAVVLVFSMATVAFAAVNYTYVCDRCNGTITNSAEFTAHVAADKCAACPYCNAGFLSQAEVDEHSKTCRSFTGTCDYCGASVNKKGAYDEHVAACKAKYFNIPLAKIIATVKDLIAKIDFEAVIGTVKDLGSKVGEFIGGIDFSAIKLPA